MEDLIILIECLTGYKNTSLLAIYFVYGLLFVLYLKLMFFFSVADIWRNATNNMSDFKELIPEFYDITQGGDFLINSFGINFGYRHDGSKVHDVALPQWADDTTDFVKKLRDALESEYVSQNLNHWIDLIFGYKQRGDEAKKANNGKSSKITKV